MGEIKSLVLVISGINGKSSPKKVFIRDGVKQRQDAAVFQKKKEREKSSESGKSVVLLFSTKLLSCSLCLKKTMQY